MTALDSLKDQILDAARRQQGLRIRGSGSKDFYGQVPVGDLLDTRQYSGIVSYEPTELVISARCGTPLVELHQALAAHKQMLPFDPPSFGVGATVGGMVASGLSGPRRQAAGPLRDFVLGASLMNSAGELMYFGGQVMKNVAGYDVSRLLAGSMGVLGLITEVSLKVLPLPPADLTLAWRVTQGEALKLMNQWAGQPLPIVASAWHSGDLGVRMAGATAAVAAASRAFEQQYRAVQVPSDDALQFWTRLREQQLPFFAGEAPLWRLSVPTATKMLAIGDEQLIEWGGGVRWVRESIAASNAAAATSNAETAVSNAETAVSNVVTIREIATQAGGHATLFRGGDKSIGVMQPLAAVNWRIQQALKREFDPLAIFNPGRLYPGL